MRKKKPSSTGGLDNKDPQKNISEYCVVVSQSKFRNSRPLRCLTDRVKIVHLNPAEQK